MPKWSINGVVTGGKWLGEVEADTEEEALALGEGLDTLHVALCHQCSDQCESPQIDEINADKMED